MSQQHPRPASNRPARPLLAAFASAVVPGTGQMLAGDTRRGWMLVGIDAGLIAILLVFFNDRVDVLTAAVEPSSLALLMILNIALLGYRVWAADDAYRTARRAAGGYGGVSGTTVIAAGVVLGAVLLAPHVVFGYYDLVQYNLLTSVFGGNEAQNSTTTTTTTGNGPTSSTLPGETTTTSETTVVAGPQIWNGLDRLNILLLGGDFGAGRTGVRTDTMITVSIDPESGDVAMFSVPRNWTYAPLPDGMGIWDCNCYPELMNELWVAGEQHPEAFPGTGTPSENAVKGINSAFLGIPIHYYALVNLDGFVDIIDSIGGVDIYVPEQVIDEEYPHEDGTVERIQIDAGTQHLDGHLALAYARTRHQDSDYFRMNRQRCVLEAVLDQTEPTDLILNFQTIADVIKRSMQTDIPLDALPELVKLLPNIDRDEILSIAFIPPEYHLSFRPDGKPGRVPNVDLVQEHVRLIIDDPARAIQELGLDTLDDTCGTDGA
jgi:LCP family protein required for cell wall assembly